MVSGKVCPVCNYEATSRPLMLAHLRYMTKSLDISHCKYSEENKAFKCPVCNFRAQMKNGVGSHIQQQAEKNQDRSHIAFYEEQKKLVIQAKRNGIEVGEIMKDPLLFFARVWVNNVLQNALANVECPICNIKFRDEIGLKNHITKQDDQRHIDHMKTMNWSGAKYNVLEKCPVCGHESTWLNRHLRMRWHQGDVEHRDYMIRNFVCCPVCEERYENHIAIANHFKKVDDLDHNGFMEKQSSKIKEYYRQGLSIQDIQKKDDIYIKDSIGLGEIVKEEFTDEQIKKQRYKVMGNKNAQLYIDEPERRTQCSERMQGENNPSWHGGAGEFYRGADWRTQQRLAFEIYGNECFCCSQQTYMGTKNHVHHVLPYRLGKSNAIELLRILCKRCHKVVENRLLSADDSLVTLEYGLKILEDVKLKIQNGY